MRRNSVVFLMVMLLFLVAGCTNNTQIEEKEKTRGINCSRCSKFRIK